MKPKKFILSGGGTGGHIFPAIAIAKELRNQLPDCEILFVGANDKMEMQKVPDAGFEIKGLWISGFQRKITLQNILFPVKLLKSLWDARKIVKNFKPDVVIGTGGFASGPLLKVANFLKIPTVIQEQNSIPGITNKLLAKDASKICVAYDGLEKIFKSEKVILTGNPIREDLIDIKIDKNLVLEKYKLNPNTKTVLVLGGSLGARRVNQIMERTINSNFFANNLQVIWQCGKLYEKDYIQYNSETIKVVTFIENMKDVYGIADVIISRAGASSISELCLVAKPLLLIPSPNVAEDHQTHNAKALVDKGAALMIKEINLDIDFEKELEKLISDSNIQEEMRKNLLKLSKPNATKSIVNEILNLTK